MLNEFNTLNLKALGLVRLLCLRQRAGLPAPPRRLRGCWGSPQGCICSSGWERSQLLRDGLLPTANLSPSAATSISSPLFHTTIGNLGHLGLDVSSLSKANALAAVFYLNCSLSNTFNIRVLRSLLYLTAVTAQLHLPDVVAVSISQNRTYRSCSDGAGIEALGYLDIVGLKTLYPPLRAGW